MIRPLRDEDGDAVRVIERRAGERFRELGMHDIADDEPIPVETLREFAVAGRGWVAADDADRPVGYAVAEVLDGCAHLEQISVLPDRQGTGVGRALLDAVTGWARSTGRPAVTLTTFAEVPWNRPLYEHLGFRVLDHDELGPELRDRRDLEARHGLDPSTRVCMRLDLDPRIDPGSAAGQITQSSPSHATSPDAAPLTTRIGLRSDHAVRSTSTNASEGWAPDTP